MHVSTRISNDENSDYDSNRFPAPVSASWGHIQLQPVNASVAAVTLMPGATVRGTPLLVWLVRSSDGLQSGWAAESGTNAAASSV
jgi:hypothetical protein